MSGSGESASKERSLDSVTRRVMWGEDDGRILESLKLQGLPETDALELLRTAHRDRVKTIRGIYRPKIWRGLLFIGLGVGIVSAVYVLTEGYTIWSGRAVVVPLAPFIYGAWQFLNGLTGIMTAGSRSGPVSEIE